MKERLKKILPILGILCGACLGLYWTLYLLWGAFFVTLFLGSGFPTALVSVLIVLHCVFLMVNMNRWAKRM